MKSSFVSGFLVATAIAAAFVVGRASVEAADPLLAQGRGTRPPSNRRIAKPPVPQRPKDEAPLVWEADGGQAAAANGVLAVTGSYGVGTSVLYVVDTVNRQLAVYEARGGSPGSRRVYLVGARRIDLDLQLLSYNDESEFGYEELRRMFERNRSGAAAKESERPSAPPTGRSK